MDEQAIRRSSAFRFYSKGIVAANKPLGSNTIEVTNLEDHPMQSGETTDNTTEYAGKAEDDKGRGSVDVKLKTTGSIKAHWYPWGNTNRVTAPDVRRGEEVQIIQFADSDEYFWFEGKHHHDLRRLETITFRLCNVREENTRVDHTNSYFFHLSTHEKLLHIETTKSDGEPFAYQFQFNTGTGLVTLKDDDGQRIFMDSKERHIRIENKDGSVIEMNKRVINLSSVDEINLKTKRYTLNASESIVEATKNHNYRVSTYAGQAETYALKAGTYNAQSTFTYTGNSVFNGNNRVNGNSHITGNSYEGSSSGPGNSR